MTKINKYLFIIFLTFVNISSILAMETEKKEAQEQSFFEVLPAEMIFNILEYVMHQSNLVAENSTQLDQSFTSLYLINHQILDLIRKTKLKKIIHNMLLNKAGKLNKWQALIDLVDKFSVTTGQEFILKAEQGDIKRVKALVFAGVDVNRQSKSCGVPSILEAFRGHTALTASISKNKKEVVKFLINEGADINKATNSLETPLTIAVKENNPEILKILLDAGADVNIKGSPSLISRPITPLMIAASKGFEEIVKMLLEANANVNGHEQYEDSALISAASYGFLSIVQMLIDAGAEISYQNEQGETALTIANQNKHFDIAQLLEEASKSK